MPRIRTGYSFRTAVGRIEEVLDRLQECNYKYAPITDRASCFGYVRYAKEAAVRGMRPIFGIELAVTDDATAKKPIVDHWTFIATDSLQPIYSLLLQATQQFRYEPLLTYGQALSAPVPRIMGRRTRLEHVQPVPGLYAAASPSMSPGLLRQAADIGIPFIACSDNYYPKEEDAGFYQVLIGRNASVQTWPQFILTDDQWYDCMKTKGINNNLLDIARTNAHLVCEQSTAMLPKGKILRPDRTETLEDTCIKNASKLLCPIDQPTYRERLTYELQLIRDKGFEDYFYIVGDTVRWARERMAVGPARGSSAGSLVCYLLGITTIDPIKYDLLFERFIDLNRSDFPDIDIDFNDSKREQVFAYLQSKYGIEYVGKLGAVTTYQSDSALNETAAAMDIPRWETEPVKRVINKKESTLKDSLNSTDVGKALLSKWPEMAIAGRIEGHPRHHTQHPAGILLTDKPISEYVAMDARTGAVHADLKDADTLGLLKIDALGITQLRIFEHCLSLIGKPFSWLEAVPLDNPAAFAVLNRKHFSGISQFQGAALANLSKNIHFTDLEDMVALTSLARPGPLGSGATNSWIRRKNGQEEITYAHPSFESYTKSTYGVITYQEQVMHIVRNIGGLSWEDVTDVRKSMGKSLGRDYMDRYGNQFKFGAISNGLSADIANRAWSDMLTFGGYAFNRSHAVAYAIMSYWCCYLKAHFPLEFAAATLTAETDTDKQIQLLRELNEIGIQYIPIDADLSTDVWQIITIDSKKMLLGPLSLVRNIGPKMVEACMAAKSRNESLPEKAQKLLTDAKTEIDSLWPIRDATKRIVPNLADRNILTRPETVIELLDGTTDRTIVFVGIVSKIKRKDENDAASLERRNGYKITDSNVDSLHLQLQDDTGTIFAKINRWQYPRLAKDIIDHGRAGKAVYAVKGKLWKTDDDFRGIAVESVRFLGDVE